MTEKHTGRRTIVQGLAVGGMALPLLAACGSGSGHSGRTPAEVSVPTGEGGKLVGQAEVPVGGGVVLADQRAVVTQPKAGEFKAFSAVCTHQQCLVSSVSGKEIHCPCHGSSYSIEDGSVTNGPARDPLPKIPVAGKGDQVVVTSSSTS